LFSALKAKLVQEEGSSHELRKHDGTYQPNRISTMKNKPNKSIEVVPIDRALIDLHQLVNDIDPMQLFHLSLSIFAIVTGIKKLLRYARKITNGKGSQIDRQVTLQVVGSILAILKGLAQLFDNLDDRDDAE
jgi:hypothetical protein